MQNSLHRLESLEAELLRRDAIRSSLDRWSEACDLTPAKHHRLINSELEKVERGETPKLMIFLPPGSAKSTYSSVQFPPWYLARKEGRDVLACSHSADLVTSFGRRCRNLIELHSTILGYELAKDSKAADNWKTTNNGGYLCAGVGAGIAGRRADLGILDDVIGKKEDADSKLYRDKCWSWYIFDFLTRLKPSAQQVIILTRWHEDDLAGRLLASEADQWKVINIPLEAGENDPLGRSPGELLWPEWFNASTLANAKKDARAYNCLWQQNPTPEAGNYFEAEFIQTYEPEQLPRHMRFYCGSDHAISLKDDANPSCLGTVGVDNNDNLWVMPDLDWEKMPSDVQVEKMLDRAKKDKPLMWWAERGHISASIGPFLNKMMVERNVYIPLEEVVSSRDKATRAQPVKARMRQRKIFFPGFAPWWPKAYHQLLTFPAGTADDFVDFLSEIGQGLDRIVKVQNPENEIDLRTEMEKGFEPTLAWVKQSDKAMRRGVVISDM